MELRITHRDGPARIIKGTHGDHSFTTPLLVFPHTHRYSSPSFARALITHQAPANSSMQFTVTDNFFESSPKTSVNDTCAFSRYLLYPSEISNTLNKTKNNTPCVILSPDVSTDTPPEKSLAKIIALASAKQLFQHQSKFASIICKIRDTLSYDQMVYTPSIASPMNLSLLVYLGIDVIDSTLAIPAARNRQMLFPFGYLLLEQLHENPCSCPSCSQLSDPKELSFEQLLQHNYYMYLNELRLVNNTIINGQLRDLVEQRVRSDPLLTSILRILDYTQYEFFEERTPITKNATVRATSLEALWRPEVKRFQQRVMKQYCKTNSQKILLLLPCSAKKPYSTSKSHYFYQKAIQATKNPGVIHEVIITSPLGLVPRELELVYPASNYDTTVTDVWDHEEQSMIQQQLRTFVEKHAYDHSVVHLSPQLQKIVCPVLPNAQVTCNDNPTSDESLQQLTEVLHTLVSSYEHISKQQQMKQHLFGMLCYQFSKDGAQILLDQSEIKGRYPYWKLMDGSTQLGMITLPRGLCSLTLEGGQRLDTLKYHRIDVDTGFSIKGSILTPGISQADSAIRIGDEVLLYRKGMLIGVGVAQMNGREMTELSHGEAVKVRHVIQ